MSTIQRPSEVESRRERYAERHRELMQELAANPPVVDHFDFDPTQVPVIRMGILGIVMFLGVGLAAFLGTRLAAHQKNIVVNPKPELHQAPLPIVNEREWRRPRGVGEQAYTVWVPTTATGISIHKEIYLKVKLSEEQLQRLEPQLQEGRFFPLDEIELSDEQFRLLLEKNEKRHESPPSR